MLPIGTGVAAGLIPTKTFAKTPAAKRDILKELGIRTFVNAAGTYTAMTASLMHDEVVETIKQGAKQFAMLDEVQDKVGEKIAELCNMSVNKNTIATDKSAFNPSGIRLGTAAMTTRGFKENDFGVSIQGSPIAQDSTGLTPIGNHTLSLGNNWYANNALNGHLKLVKFYPERLSNAELVSLTENN